MLSYAQLPARTWSVLMIIIDKHRYIFWYHQWICDGLYVDGVEPIYAQVRILGSLLNDVKIMTVIGVQNWRGVRFFSYRVRRLQEIREVISDWEKYQYCDKWKHPRSYSRRVFISAPSTTHEIVISYALPWNLVFVGPEVGFKNSPIESQWRCERFQSVKCEVQTVPEPSGVGEPLIPDVDVQNVDLRFRGSSSKACEIRLG